MSLRPLMNSSTSTQPSTAGPMRMPSTSSNSTLGMRQRRSSSAISGATTAAAADHHQRQRCRVRHPERLRDEVSLAVFGSLLPGRGRRRVCLVSPRWRLACSRRRLGPLGGSCRSAVAGGGERVGQPCRESFRGRSTRLRNWERSSSTTTLQLVSETFGQSLPLVLAQGRRAGDVEAQLDTGRWSCWRAGRPGRRRSRSAPRSRVRAGSGRGGPAVHRGSSVCRCTAASTSRAEGLTSATARWLPGSPMITVGTVSLPPA